MEIINRLPMLAFTLLVMIITIFVVFSVLEICTRVREYKLMNKDFKLQNEKVYLDIDLDNNVFDNLERMINDCFKEYIILNIAYEKGYINNAKENEIASDVSYMVMSRMSPIFLKKMSVFYNENLITDIITRRVYMLTMNYVIDNNSVKAKL